MGVRWLGVLAALAGCIRDDLVPCTDGRLCGAGLICDNLHQTCVTPDQLAVCASMANDSPCVTATLTGLCFDEVCLEPGCGNNVVEAGEQCDDGNFVSRDGCSIDCASNETCGNGVVDDGLGETCDDGDLVSHDGCSSRCEPETAVWKAYPLTITGTMVHSAAFDRRRGRLVYADAATWEWDGAAWTVASLTGPAREYLSPTYLVYDQVRQRVLAFDQFARASAWDGSSWTELTTTGTPPLFIGSVLYDDVTPSILVLGTDTVGQVTMSRLDATGAWTTLGTAPTGTSAGEAAFDANGDLVVTVAGNPSQTHVWNRVSRGWTSSSVAPASPGTVTVIFDEGRDAIIAVGNGVEVWQGGQWVDLGISIGRTRPTLWNDSTTGKVGVLGGAETQVVLAINSSAVTMITPPEAPRNTYTMYYDVMRERLTLFSYDAAWAWDGSLWTKVAAQPSFFPSPGWVGRAVYDPVRGAGVTIDGLGNAWTFADAWAPLAVDLAPTEIMTNFTTAYDYPNRRIVAVDTTGAWALASDGTSWVQIAGGVSGLNWVAYDVSHGNIVGLTGSHQSVGLYDLVGGAWFPSLSPGLGYYLVSALHAGTLLMIDATNSLANRPLWERRGTAFVQHPPIPTVDLTVMASAELPHGRILLVVRAGTGLEMMLERQLIGPTTADETCMAGEDADGDTRAGCDDADCWMTCAPLCPRETTCPVP